MNGKIRIEQIENSRHYKLFLNDTDISMFTRNVRIELDYRNIPIVYITLVSVAVEIPDELTGLITVERDT